MDRLAHTHSCRQYVLSLHTHVLFPPFPFYMHQQHWLSVAVLETQFCVCFHVLDSVALHLLWMCVFAFVCVRGYLWISWIFRSIFHHVWIAAHARVLAGADIKDTDKWRARARFRFTEGEEGGRESLLSLKPCLNVDYAISSCWEPHANWQCSPFLSPGKNMDLCQGTFQE